MSTQTITVTQVATNGHPKGPITPKPAGENRLFAKEGVTYGDWRDDLVRDGVAVVKGAIPRDRAEKYAEDIFTFLETL
jgi:hypothetical protein